MNEEAVMSRNTDDNKQNDLFELLRARIEARLRPFGQADSLLEPGDYAVHGDYWGYPQVKVTIHNLELLQPKVVEALQQLLGEFPDWEIVMAVAVRGHYDDWPDMGLYIRAGEIIDGLQRQYFPKPLRDIKYEGSRRGHILD
jgi:hypothetical protein